MQQGSNQCGRVPSSDFNGAHVEVLYSLYGSWASGVVHDEQSISELQKSRVHLPARERFEILTQSAHIEGPSIPGARYVPLDIS